jgi:hypothetical protein
MTDEHVILETTDVSRFRPNRRHALAVAAFLTVLIAPWVFMSDLLQVPQDVEQAEHSFRDAVSQYEQNSEQWLERKNQVILAMRRHLANGDISKRELTLQDVPMEVFIAFLDDDVDLLKDRLHGVALYPTELSSAPRFLLTKREFGIGPLQITTSLELFVENRDGGTAVSTGRLRRGSREIEPELAWIYFSDELQALRQLEAFSGGVRDLHLYEKDDQTASVRATWKYLHRRPFTGG